MIEIVRTNDLVLISAVESALQDADVPCFVADRHASVIDGSVNFVQMRVLVPEDRETEARDVLTEAELGQWLRT
jgi:hypothetical protein